MATNVQPTFKIALAGNPNSGKTTLFNALTGLRHKVANYPGVTVEKKMGSLKLLLNDVLTEVDVVDLPGTYSLSAHSEDEEVATSYLLGTLQSESLPDLVVCVIDSTNLERNLYLLSQIIDLGLPVIAALNMSDELSKFGISIKKEILARQLDLPVVSIAASKKEGIDDLKKSIEGLLTNLKSSSKAFYWAEKSSLFEQEIGKLGAYAKGRVFSPTLSELSVGSALLSDVRKNLPGDILTEIAQAKTALFAAGIDPVSYEATHRYGWLSKVIESSTTRVVEHKETISDKLDRIAIHRVWGSVVFLLIMTFIFQSIFLWASLPMEFLDSCFAQLSTYFSHLLPPGPINSLISDGIIPGVGAVLTFVPQIAILFLFLGILEDSGYLSRAAFLMDRIMRKVGLQGRSFIPLLSSFACAIPGIMATRSIPTFADRVATILIAPLMSCSARLPVYTLLIAAFIPKTYYYGFISLQGLVLLGMYLLGIFSAAAVAWIIKFSILRGTPSLLVMEMPSFRMPNVKNILRDVYERVRNFVKNAGTVILACSVLLWFLVSYPQGDIQYSYAGALGALIEPAIKPLGFNWEIGIGLLASFAAREVFVSSLATIYHVAETSKDSVFSLVELLQRKKELGEFPLASAISLMVFYAYACQCMSTLAVCKKETGSWRWPIVMFVYMTLLAYGASYVAYELAVKLGG